MKRCVMFVALAIVAASVSFASAIEPCAAVTTGGCGECADVGCDAGCVAPVCTPCLPMICVKPIALPTFRLPKLFVCQPVCLPVPKCPLTACTPCGGCGEAEADCGCGEADAGCGCGCGDADCGCGGEAGCGCGGEAGCGCCAPVCTPVCAPICVPICVPVCAPVCAPIVIPVPDLCGALAQAKCNFERDMCAVQTCATQKCTMVKARMTQIRCQPICIPVPMLPLPMFCKPVACDTGCGPAPCDACN